MIKRIVLLSNLLLSIGLLFAQTGKPFPASDLKVTWQVVENNYQGQVQTLNKLTFINQSKQTLPASGWKIYFNYGRGVKAPLPESNVTIKRINGELFEMAPTADFKAIPPKQEFVVEYVGKNWLVNYTDAAHGFYMLWEASGTYSNMSAVNIVPSTEEKQLKRTPKDNIGVITPEVIFNQNKDIQDFEASTLCPILPTPKVYTKGSGNFSITANTPVVDLANSPNEANYLAQKLSGMFGSNVKVSTTKSDNAISFVKKELANPEAYELSISTTGVEIRANDGAGFFYGIQSLLQLMPSNVFAGKQSTMNVAVVDIADAPRFGYRALHIDVSRNFRQKEEILKILDLMALYKVNVFHFHFSDDDGWRVSMPSLPELTEVGSRRGAGSELEMLIPTYGSGGDVNNTTGSGHYSEDEFIEILKYANERHIQVIPEIETPGHARAAIKSMEARYHKYMKMGNEAEAERYRLVHPEDKSEYISVQSWNDNVMDVSLPSVYAFVERVVSDLRNMYNKAGVPLYTVHMGGDEVPKGVWEKSPAFAELKKQDPSIKVVDDLWYYYFDKVNNILQSQNLFLSGWEEAGVRFTQLDGKKTMIPNSQFSNEHFQLDVWNNVLGWGAEDLAYKMANAGYKVVLSCVSNNYFDMSYYKAFDEPGYYWGSFIDIDKPFAFIPFDYYKNSTTDLNGNPISATTFACKERLTEYGKTNIVGIKGLLWSETLKSAEMAQYMILPKLISMAERAWSVDPEWATEPNKEKSQEMYNVALHKYYNVVGKFHLERLNHFAGGFNYRIPAPGVLIKNDEVSVNMQLPGFALYYTTDGKEPTMKSKLYTQPITFNKGVFKVKAFSSNGRGSRTVSVQK